MSIGMYDGNMFDTFCPFCCLLKIAELVELKHVSAPSIKLSTASVQGEKGE